MKEAAGEANMTVITIVLIAIVLAVGTVIVNNLMNRGKASSCCAANGGTWANGFCCKAGVTNCTSNQVATNNCD